MASSSGVQQSFQQQFKCKECGLALNSAESLEVHRQYHEGNLMQQWAVKVQNSNGEEKNNNMTKQPAGIKREFASNNSNSMQGDSSDNQKKSPDYHRTTPEGIYGHPPTPQSYQSASSPYQNNDNSAFSPNFQNFPIKSEAGSPASQQQGHYQSFPIKSEAGSPASQQQGHYQSFPNFPEQQQQQFFAMDSNSPYSQEIHGNKIGLASFRYHPYGRSQYYEPSKSSVGAPPVSPAYPPQPTPSPSPKQCDKCGYVCESAAQLIEHNNLTHSGNAQVPPQYSQSNHFMFDQQTVVKEEDTSQSEILDLDSHKVVHPDWADGKEGDKRPNSDTGIPHSVSAMLNSWPPHSQQQQDAMFQGEHNMYMNDSSEQQKMFPNLPVIPSNKMFSSEQKLFQSHQMDNQNFINNAVSSSNSDMGNQQPYRAFEHLPTGSSSSVITSTQVPQVPTANPPAPPTGTKSANWKSNEARRPKTYNCTACNKWFTSSGHLKRHYNTTLHKNAVKSSGQPDPATLPISAHHHPSRDSSNREDRTNSNSPREDSKGEDSNGMGSQYDNRLSSMPGLLQHPPNSPYDRQGMHHTPPMHSPLGQHHTPLANPSPLGGHMMQNPGFPNLANGSPPNGDAGLSPPDSRGLLSMAPATHNFNMMSQPHMMPMEATQFQMYPNGSAPHVTQATDTTSNLNITGEPLQYVVQTENQPLPSFAQIQAHRFSGGYANVGGVGSVTVPTSFTYFSNEGFDLNDSTRNMMLKEDDESAYKLSIITAEEGVIEQQSVHDISQVSEFSPTSSSNNNNDVTFNELSQSTTYISPEASQAIAQPLSISTDSQGESKENYEEGNSTGSPSISSTVANQEDLSKTKCFDCDKVFNRPCYLTQHNKTCHNGDKPFKCSRCGKRFSDEDTYKEHTRKHAGDKPHKCDMCPKMFNHKTDLRRHLCCHTGRKPYACEICGKGFIRKDHMIKHMDTHQRKKDKLGAMRS